MFEDRDVQKIINGVPLFSGYASKGSFSLNELKNKEVGLYGVGQCAHWFHEIAMKLHGIKLKIALDKQPKFDVWCGVPVIKPLRVNFELNTLQRMHIVVCIGDWKEFCNIKNLLKKIGFKHIHYWGEFYEAHFPLYQSSKEFVEYTPNEKEEISAAFNLFKDDLSKEIFLRVLQTSRTGIPSLVPFSSNHLQYFPSDVPLQNSYKTYVCCGSYDGENIRKMYQILGRVEAMFCFEPEPKIFDLEWYKRFI